MPSNSTFRSLMAASQGPRPLSNVFAYRASRMPRPMPPLRPPNHFAPMVQNQAFGNRTQYPRMPMPNEENARESTEDNRKPPPGSEPTEIPSSTDMGVSGSMARAGFDLRSDNSPQHPQTLASLALELTSTAFQPSHPETRSRKRRVDDTRPVTIFQGSEVASKEGQPAAKLKTDWDECSDTGSCCICMCDPDEGERSSIDGCDHIFCFECIEKWSERENSCPLCKVRFNRITRVDKTKKKKGQKGTKKVKQRDQRADLNAGNALEGLLGTCFVPSFICDWVKLIFVFTAGLNANSGFSSSIARLIFSGLGPSSGGGVIDFGLGAAGGPPIMGRRGGSRQVRFRNPPTQIEDAFFSDNDDGSDDDQTGYADFVTNMRRMNQQRGAAVFGAYPMLPETGAMVPIGRQGPDRTAAAMAAAMAASHMTRSYATNGHVADAGGTADNALEIESDSDEDEVEVIDVRGGA